MSDYPTDDLIDTSTTEGQRAWAGLCNHAFENLPTNTTVTFDDVSAILTWTLWKYEEITAPARAGRPQTEQDRYAVKINEEPLLDLVPRSTLSAATARAERAERERDEAREDADELNRLFEIQQRRMREATETWRAEAPEERALVLPDLGNLLAWLVSRAERAEADVVVLDIQRANLADAVGRVTALADEWCAMDPYGEISFNDAADALRAALDAQRPAEGGPEGEGAEVTRLKAEVARQADRFANLGDRPTFDQFAAAEKALRDARAAALDGGQPDTPAPEAEPAIDIYGRPCTVYMAPEGCTDPYRCRVHRGAYPAPAPTRSGEEER